MSTAVEQPLVCPQFENPVEQFVRTDRMPHIWCPGCGIGTSVNSFDPHARSKYRPPNKTAAPLMRSVKMFCSTKGEVRMVQG